jgi:putative oxidoreductase
MSQNIFTSQPSPMGLTTTRVAVAGLMFAHGAWKLGAWGGPGYEGLSRWFTETLHLPGGVAILVVLGETVGAVLLAAGAFTRIVAASVILTMLGAIVKVHWPNGFFMNWTGAAAGEGFELHLLVIAMASQLVMAGGGAAALDPYIGRLFEARRRRLATA